MEKLIKILEKFDTLRDYFLNKEIKWDESAVAECFKPCAEEILCGGYFLVNGKYIIDLGCIELYYHEEGENGRIKDPIMYHTNDKGSYSKFYNKEDGLPFFILGSFNPHTSGIDVTFESEKNRYRASFLIRTYRVLENEDDLKSDRINFDTCSTHIYDDLFPKGVFFGKNEQFKIEWRSYSKGGEVIQCKRINVLEFEKNETGKYVRGEKAESRDWGFKHVFKNKID